ncbi:MAG: ribosome biogenesis GTPase Der [bacterium]
MNLATHTEDPADDTADLEVTSGGPSPAGKRRVVAIVGRPNVGKSAVFNRIAGKRIAIVHDEAGVTRDRLMSEVTWDSARFELVDTGGVSLLDGQRARDAITAGIRAQVDAALADAAVAILVVDVIAGRNPVDEAVAAIVRRSGVPCVVAVNKCDEPRHEENLHDFEPLNMPLFPVAALHDRGFGDLMDAVLPHLPDMVNETVARPLKVAIVGRPNAGKSSYINRLLKSERVIVSEIPGTTRDSISVPFRIGSGDQARHYTLIDTAGMRHVHKIDNAVERFSLFRAESSVAEADVVVLVMDSEIGPTVQDKHIASLIQQHEKGCVLVVNKWDLAQEKDITQTKAEPALRAMMPFMRHCPVVFLSAKTGYNVRKSVEVIDHVASQTRLRLPTGVLNRALEDAGERVAAPMIGGKRFKLYYGTQVGVAPVTIRIFVNDPKRITKPYSDYLVRSLRERFGLEGAVVRLRFQERIRPELPGLSVPGHSRSPAKHLPARYARRKKGNRKD